MYRRQWKDALPYRTEVGSAKIPVPGICEAARAKVAGRAGRWGGKAEGQCKSRVGVTAARGSRSRVMEGSSGNSRQTARGQAALAAHEQN